jgi:hypothetical protein
MQLIQSINSMNMSTKSGRNIMMSANSSDQLAPPTPVAASGTDFGYAAADELVSSGMLNSDCTAHILVQSQGGFREAAGPYELPTSPAQTSAYEQLLAMVDAQHSLQQQQRGHGWAPATAAPALIIPAHAATLSAAASSSDLQAQLLLAAHMQQSQAFASPGSPGLTHSGEQPSDVTSAMIRPGPIRTGAAMAPPRGLAPAAHHAWQAGRLTRPALAVAVAPSSPMLYGVPPALHSAGLLSRTSSRASLGGDPLPSTAQARTEYVTESVSSGGHTGWGVLSAQVGMTRPLNLHGGSGPHSSLSWQTQGELHGALFLLHIRAQ